jgi:Fe-S oxidoreductase
LLTPTERIIFVIMVILLGGLTAAGFYGIYKIIRSGRPAPPLKNVTRRLIGAFIDVGLQKTIFRTRPILSTFHAFIFFGFSFYFLVNFTDVLEGFIPGFELIYGGQALATLSPALAGLANLGLVNLFNLVADILSVLTLVGMVAFLVRRFIRNDRQLTFNDNVLLHPQVAQGWIRRDSAIVGGFILIHVGSRFLGQAFRLAEQGQPDPFMPFASLAANLFANLPDSVLNAGIHITWWLAIGLILVFFPYFVRSKHIHLMLAPLNLGLTKQSPRGQLDPASPNGVAVETLPGAKTVQDLAWPRLLDAYACIMCNRCQEVCPAYNSGRPLSPAAVEVNKRYLFNQDFLALARGGASDKPLLEHVINPEAVWACTTCYACIRVCPVGNEPMADIIDIRRRMVYDGAEIDTGIQTALESIGKNGNWFGKGARARAAWTKELDFEIKDVTSEAAEYLWFVGDTASFDARVIPLTQKVAGILRHAGVDYGILYKEERNAGNDVRRAGEEGLFEQLVEENLKAFGKSQFTQILTTDPHSLNALRNEYPQYGGMWPVHHYTNILLQLVEAGRLELKQQLSHYRATYHDPCYLGRYNRGYEAPRRLLALLGVNFVEMPRHMENSYCCGAGGGQIWLSTTPAGERPAESRIREALATLASMTNGRGAPAESKLLFVVACPKDIIMYTDAVKTTGNEDKIEVRDIVQLVEESLGLLEATGQPAEAPVQVTA